MKRELIKTGNFVRFVKKLLQKRPRLAEDVAITLLRMEEDIYHPFLKTHKLVGTHQGSWACSVEYDLRIIFTFEQVDGKEVILLETIGTHDEVY